MRSRLQGMASAVVGGEMIENNSGIVGEGQVVQREITKQFEASSRSGVLHVPVPGQSPLDIRCSRCGSCAQFYEPFRFTAVIRFHDLPPNSHRWGRVVVEELFPDFYRWHQPATSKPTFINKDDDRPGYRLGHKGMISCKFCDEYWPASISWPRDAYWQWNIFGYELVARNREHAQSILAYLRERKRSHLGSIYIRFSAPKLYEAVADTLCKI